MRFTANSHLHRIHPHLHVPASLQGCEELGGGGSGVTILSGRDPDFGSVVVKHGGPRDTGELFALATIEHELRQRRHVDGAAQAAANMWERTPDFRFLYISQAHLRDRAAQLWGMVRNIHRALSLSRGDTPKTNGTSIPIVAEVGDQAFIGKGRTLGRGIRVCGLTCRQHKRGDECTQLVELAADRLEVRLDVDATFGEHRKAQCSETGHGYRFMQDFIEQIIQLQKSHLFKFSLAQKTIGGPSASTASALLVQGKLTESWLQKLIDEVVRTIRNLQVLTLPEETEAAHAVQQELAAMADASRRDPSHVSALADSYVGFAIKKNFHPKHGRFRMLRELGAAFRMSSLRLTTAEVLPAKHLGLLLEAGAQMKDVFVPAPDGATALDACYDIWYGLLVDATSVRGAAACNRVWNCGLSDAGLHNLFLGEDGVWFFDMGKPALLPVPAFLTKFLFSFFHTLGMEECSRGSWVNCFEPGERLRLTAQTASILPKVYESFRATLASLVRDVFEGEEEVRHLLMNYVVLQLLSDCAFCLQRWQDKGGGQATTQDRTLEKWLWRALWDIYIASDVCNKQWGA